MVNRGNLCRIAGGCIAGLLLAAAAGAQVLTIAAIYRNTPIGFVNGIIRTRTVVVSHDGKNAYATGESQGTLAVFSRNETNGLLTQIQLFRNGVGGIDGIGGANVVRESADGKNIYVTGFGGDSIGVFARDVATGLLTQIQVLKDNTPAVPDGLNGTNWIALTDDGENAYATGFFDDAIVVFDRDEDTGILTFRQLLKDGVDGINGIGGAYPIFIDPKKGHVYVGALEDNTLSVFERDKDGELSLVQELTDGVNGIDGLAGIRGIYGDSKGKNIYTVGLVDDAVAVFDRNNGHGTLTQTQVIKDTDPGIDGLDGATGITVTPDDHHVIATGFNERKMAVFEREETGHSRGELTLVQVLNNLIDTPLGLNGPIDVAASPDGCQIYNSSFNVDIILQWDVTNCGDDGNNGHGNDD